MQDIIRCRHAIPGRIRLQISLSKPHHILVLIMQDKIGSIHGVKQYSVNPGTGRILIFYDRNQIRGSALLKQINITFTCLIQGALDETDPLSRHAFNEAAAQLQVPGSEVRKFWYEMAAEETLEILSSHPQKGLSIPECHNRLRVFGPNQFAESPRPSLLSLFLGQFNLMTYLLLGAGAVSLLLRQLTDAVSILVIVAVEALIGMIQENRAEKSLAGLKRMTAPEAIVIRGGRPMRIPAGELVPGDIILLEAGSMVPADCRLLSCSTLEVKEDSLTGESQAVYKQSAPRSDQNLSLAEQDNMVFMGTYVTRGRAQAVVVKTGDSTEMGRIAALLGSLDEEKTPLQKQLNKLGRDLSYICLGLCAGITALGILRGQAVFNMLRTGISLAVGAIPEGLPAIVTISMAFGVQRMAGKNAVVRRLPVVETLAYATVICSDKTGTLTGNEMTVTELYVDNSRITVSGKGYTPQGMFFRDEEPIQPDEMDTMQKLLYIGVLCNNARIRYHKQEEKWQVLGDPTEAALLVLARKAGIDRSRLEQMMPREVEVPFEADTRLMGVVLRDDSGQRMLFVKGAPDQVLEHCSHEYRTRQTKELTLRRRNKILAVGEDMASRALRVIATAYKVLEDDTADPASLFDNLIFTGLAGMLDPPRPEVRRALGKCRQAGIKVIMITGDQQQTAVAVARELDMLGPGLQLSGNEIDAMSDEELTHYLPQIELIYRASPVQKLRMVRAYKKQGLVVIMTGDGVNDAPAVKEAHVGISMGQGGTDVTREVSGITLTDDSFATIVTAVEEGRAIRANIRKFIRYVLAGNLGEILAVSGCSLLGLPIPLEPGHILWVNLVTEGIPALALGMDPPAPGCMQVRPENPEQKILDARLGKQILARGGAIGATTMGVFAWGLLTGPGNIGRAKTMALSNLISCQMFNVFDSRRADNGINKASIPTNPYLLPSVLLSSGLLLGIIYIPWLRRLFNTYPLGFTDWITVLCSSGVLSRLGGRGAEQVAKLPAPSHNSWDLAAKYKSQPLSALSPPSDAAGKLNPSTSMGQGGLIL